MIKQQEVEILRAFVKRFNKEILEVDEVDDQVLLIDFQAGLTSEDFIFAMAKSPPTMMTDLMFKAQKYMNGEDTLTAKCIVNERKKKKWTMNSTDDHFWFHQFRGIGWKQIALSMKC